MTKTPNSRIGAVKQAGFVCLGEHPTVAPSMIPSIAPGASSSSSTFHPSGFAVGLLFLLFHPLSFPVALLLNMRFRSLKLPSGIDPRRYFHPFWGFSLNSSFPYGPLLRFFVIDTIAFVITIFALIWKSTDDVSYTYTEAIGVLVCIRLTLFGGLAHLNDRFQRTVRSLLNPNSKMSLSKEQGSNRRFVSEESLIVSSLAAEGIVDRMKRGTVAQGVEIDNTTIHSDLKRLVPQISEGSSPSQYLCYLRMISVQLHTFVRNFFAYFVPFIAAAVPPFVPYIYRESKGEFDNGDTKNLIVTISFIISTYLFSFTGTSWFATSCLRFLRKRLELRQFEALILPNFSAGLDSYRCPLPGVKHWSLCDPTAANIQTVARVFRMIITRHKIMSAAEGVSIACFSVVAVIIGVNVVVQLVGGDLESGVFAFTFLVAFLYFAVLVALLQLCGALLNSVRSRLTVSISDQLLNVETQQWEEDPVSRKLRPQLIALRDRLLEKSDEEKWLGIKMSYGMTYFWIFIVVIVGTIGFLKLL